MRKILYAVLATLTLSSCFKKVEFENRGQNNNFINPNADVSGEYPSCRITSTSSGWLRVNEFTLRYNCSEAVKDPDDLIRKVECQLNSGAWTDCDSSTSNVFASLPDQSNNRLSIRARANSNKLSPVVGLTLNVDGFVPTIDVLSFDGMNDLNPEFTVNITEKGSGIDRVLCRNGTSGSWNTCNLQGSKLTLSGVAANTNFTLQLRAVDRAGNDSSVASVSYYTAVAAPQNKCIISQLASPTMLRSASFSFQCAVSGSSRTIVQRQCKVDAGTWQTCLTHTTHGISGLSEGSHTFYVRYVDSVGLTSPSAEMNWVVDATRPDVQITSAIVDGLEARFTYTVNDTQGIERTECAVHPSGQAPTYLPCNNNYTATNLSPGVSYLFRVRAVDFAGNVGSAQYDWDTTPPSGLPSCTISTVFPNGYSTSSSSPISFSCSSPHGPVSNPECKVGSSAWATCSTGSSHLVQGLTDNQEARFCVRASDKWGRKSSDSNCLNWRVSLVAPVMRTIAVDVAHPWAKLYFSSETSSCPVSRFECKLQRQEGADYVSMHDWKTCTSPELYSGLELDKNYYFSARAHTQCGQVSTTRSIIWKSRVAYNGPVCTVAAVTPPTSGWYSSSPAQYRITCDGTAPAASFECSSDSATWTACTNPVNVNANSTGTVVSYARGVDTGGFHGQMVESQWKFDLTDPVARVDSMNWDPGTLRIFFTGSDVGSGVSHYQCMIQGVTSWANCTSPISFTQNALFTAGATHKFMLRAIDRSGRISPVAEKTWTNGDWSTWGACIANTSGSGGTRTRTCNSPATSGGGLSCQGVSSEACTPPPPPTCTNGASNHPTCTTCPAGKGMVSGQCKPLAANGGWGAYGACSKTCGGGVQVSQCAQPTPDFAGSTCTAGQTRTQACNQQACCYASGTYLGRGDVPGQVRGEVSCNSSAMPGPVIVPDTYVGCCSGQMRYSNPLEKTLITCGPGTNCNFCLRHPPAPANYNWDNWEVRCN